MFHTVRRFQLTAIMLTLFLLKLDASKKDLTKIFNLKRTIYPISDQMKNFFDRTIDNYSTEKSGFLLMYINDVPDEYKEYIMGRISKTSSAVILNLFMDRSVASNVSL